eukprot:1119606-Rhodomonas_salina.3
MAQSLQRPVECADNRMSIAELGVEESGDQHNTAGSRGGARRLVANCTCSHVKQMSDANSWAGVHYVSPGHRIARGAILR